MSTRSVLFVLTDAKLGGAERLTLVLAGALAARGWRVTVFLAKRQGEFLDRIPPGVRLVCGAGPGRLVVHLPMILGRLAHEAGRHQVVVGAMELDPTWMAGLAAFIRGRPLVAWVHVAMRPYLQRLTSGVAVQELVRVVYAQVTRVVCVSQGVADDLAALIDVPLPQTWRTVMNPLLPAEVPATAVVQVTPPGDGPLVLAVGRLDRQKGFDVLLRAVATVRAGGVPVRLLILGEGPERPALERLAQELALGAALMMPGFQPAPFAVPAEVFVLPSRFEGFGLALVEAMAAGLPVIASDCPAGPAEILRQGQDGVLVPVEDDRALASALVNLLADPQRRAALATAGRSRAATFSLEPFVDAWERVLEDARCA